MKKNTLASLLYIFLFATKAFALEKIVYAAPISLPASICYLAELKGYFKSEGLDVEEKLFSSGRDALEALLAKQAQMQSVSETPIVHAVVQGNDVVTIATVSEHHEAKLIARRDHGITAPLDLKGKRVATAAGTNADYFMHMFLKKYGLKISELQIINMKAPEMKVALIKGDIDAYFGWEPHVYYAQKELKDKAITFESNELYNGRQTVNMNRDYALAHPETVRKIIRALLKAETFIHEHPAEAQRLVADKLQIDPKDVAALWKEIHFKVELDRDLLSIYSEIGRWSMELRHQSGKLPDFRAHVYARALRAEKKSVVQIR